MKITFVELSAFESMLPLASGYMQAYACEDAEVRSRCSFDIFATSVDSDREWIFAELAARGSDVYAIGCYIWNMTLVRELLARLRDAHPAATFLLGGPQVMNHASEYVPRDAENVFVCNGEGERTFLAFVRELLSSQPDFTAVPGLSFMRHGRVVTTEAAPRIRDLAEIPSPFAAGIFDGGKFSTAILETTRGCPFRCAFCFWGAATNDRVHRFEEERIRADIEWIAKNGFIAVEIIDANWGMLPRDVELTRHIVECAERYGYPLIVSFASAKNSASRVAEIAELLVRGSLLTSQPISLQTMSEETLDLVDRSNIKYEAYASLQRQLTEKGISSYIELIWPLPGETVDSFLSGIGQLCRAEAETMIVYPQLLLRNTPIYRDRQRLGVKVQRVASDVAEADVVVETKWVDRAGYEDGVWIAYAMHALYNVRGLYYASSYLNRSGRSQFEETIRAAADDFRLRGDSAICRFFEESVKNLANFEFHNLGSVGHMALHANREEFDRLLIDFVRAQEWADDPLLRVAFELDLVARPYIYAERPLIPAYDFEFLDPVASGEYGIEISVPPSFAAAVGPALSVPGLEEADRLLVEHRRGRKLPMMTRRSLRHNLSYCQGMTLRLRELLPTITVPAREPAVAERDRVPA